MESVHLPTCEYPRLLFNGTRMFMSYFEHEILSIFSLEYFLVFQWYLEHQYQKMTPNSFIVVISHLIPPH